MGGVSCLRRHSADGDHTHALFADQSHSIPDNLVALLGSIRAWHCSTENARAAVGVIFDMERRSSQWTRPASSLTSGSKGSRRRPLALMVEKPILRSLAQ